MEEVIKLNAVDQYNKMFGLETLHPLVSVVDLSEATGYPRHFTLNYGVYAIVQGEMPGISGGFGQIDYADQRMQGFETEHLVVLVYSIELDYFFHKRSC